MSLPRDMHDAPTLHAIATLFHCAGVVMDGMVDVRCLSSEVSNTDRQWLIDNEMVFWSGANFEITDRGHVWLSHLLATPLPVAETKWSRGKIP